LVVLQIGKAKDLSAPLRTWTLDYPATDNAEVTLALVAMVTPVARSHPNCRVVWFQNVSITPPIWHKKCWLTTSGKRKFFFFQKSSIFWDITSCSRSEVNRCFEGTCRLHLQGRKNNPSKKPAWSR
jgi:hypothetical protein